MKKVIEGGFVQLPKAFYLVTILATLNFVASTLVQPFFSLYIDQKVSSTFELGLIISLMSYTTLIVRLPLGLISNKLGMWWIVPLALIGQTVSNILYSLASQPIHFYVIRVFHAIALASLQPTFMSLATTFSPENKKGEAIGVYLTSVGLAMMTGPLICSLLLQFFSFEIILLIASGIPLGILPVYLILIKSEGINEQLSRTSAHETFSQSLLRVKKIISTKVILSLTYGRFMFAITSAVITTLYGVYAVNELNIDPAIYALFFTLRGLANTFARLPTGRLSDRIGRKKPLLSSFLLFTIVFYLLSEIRDSVLISLLIFLYGMAHGIRAVSEWSFLGDIVSREDRSLTNFYFSSVFDFGMAIGATFAGIAALILSTQDILKITALLIGSSVLVIGRLKEAIRQ